MRWLNHRTRVLLFAVIAFLALTVIIIGVIRAVNPELNLMELIGLADDEKSTTIRTKPYWNDLTAEQRDALAPLEQVWDRIATARKKKWLEIAQRMESMSPEARKRMQKRIQVWVNLTPEERKEARHNYLLAKKLEVRNKSLQWQEYQSLPEEKKRELAEKARKQRQRQLGETPPPAEKPATAPPETPQTTKSSSKEDEPEYWR
ncbi:MAG: DUF3106 domain-containing protein [Burkholderiaceae bacterium]|jgi:hypothetical protein|nr:DUF3106 domain-containing protein [Burkholderiaceae bacterium]